MSDAYLLARRLLAGEIRFWPHVHAPFLRRDLTREDVRQVVRCSLEASGGSYQRAVELLGMPPGDYKRFLNFLGAHGCTVDYRPFREPRRRHRPSSKEA